MIKELILVAPWKIADRKDTYKKSFYKFPIDKTIKERVNKIVMFTSDNEEENGKKSLKLYQKKLAGKVIELPGRGHFCFENMGTEEFPELLKEVI